MATQDDKIGVGTTMTQQELLHREIGAAAADNTDYHNRLRDEEFARNERLRGDDKFIHFMRQHVEAMLHGFGENRNLGNQYHADQLGKLREVLAGTAVAMGWT
jgi:hypothetical protein